MSDLLMEPLPPQRPLEQQAQLETDAFCEHCGYNLHGQPVSRDQHLGILVCRCPECGRFHPAGHKTAASNIWLSRLAASALLVWVLMILTAVFLIVLGFGAIQWLHMDLFTYNWQIAPDGREIVYREITSATGGAQWIPVYAGTTQPVAGNVIRQVRSLRPSARQEDHQSERTWQDLALINFLSAGLGLLTGILLVVVFWHWKKRRYPLVILLPVAAAAWVLVVGVYLDDEFELVRTWAAQRVIYHAMIQGAFIFLGILIGRPIARTLVRLFIPPRPRQHLNFLWYADGKTPPGAKVA